MNLATFTVEILNRKLLYSVEDSLEKLEHLQTLLKAETVFLSISHYWGEHILLKRTVSPQCSSTLFSFISIFRTVYRNIDVPTTFCNIPRKVFVKFYILRLNAATVYQKYCLVYQCSKCPVATPVYILDLGYRCPEPAVTLIHARTITCGKFC